MLVRLTRKLADVLNGVDLRAYRVGEIINLSDPLAEMLIAERWAEEAVLFNSRSTADDRARRPKLKARSRRRP